MTKCNRELPLTLQVEHIAQELWSHNCRLNGLGDLKWDEVTPAVRTFWRSTAKLARELICDKSYADGLNYAARVVSNEREAEILRNKAEGIAGNA